MEQRILKYSTVQLLEEKTFIAWVLHGHKNKEWEEFLENHSEFRPVAIEAHEIILLLHDKHDVMDEASVQDMWQRISDYNKLHQQKIRNLSIRRSFSRAAAILLIISVGVLGSYYLDVNTRGFRFGSDYSPESNNARMVLSTGEEITLKKDNSTISLNDLDDLLIVNDSIIDLRQKTDSGKQEIQMHELVIPFGKRAELLLADGTRVWLNAGSRLAFPSRFTKNTRQVYLEGEACFQVSSNESQAFIVKTGNLEVKVLGTHFNVYAYPGNKTIETTLLSGSVSVSRPQFFGVTRNEVVLKPYQRAIFDKQNSKIDVSDEPDAEIYFSWTHGWLEYRKESLISVLDKVKIYYNVEFQLSDNFPQDDIITGKLDLRDSIEEVMMILADASDIEFRITDNKVFIERK